MHKPFVLETDHLNLVSLQEGSIAQSARCTRWRQYLAQFVYVIRHIAGVRNAIADFLSRAMEPIEASTVTYLAAIFQTVSQNNIEMTKTMSVKLQHKTTRKPQLKTVIASLASSLPTRMIMSTQCTKSQDHWRQEDQIPRRR